MTRRRVVYAIGQLAMGGGERQLLQLVQRLDRSRFAPEVITFTPGGELEPEFRATCPLHVLPKRPLTEIPVLLSLISLLRRPRAEILHTYLYPATWRGTLAARLAGTRGIVQFVGNMADWMGPVRLSLQRMAARRASAVIYEAPPVGRYLVEKAGVPEDRTLMIPNGVDLDLFGPGSGGERHRQEIWGEAPVKVIGAVMSLSEKKNPLLLVEAAARVASAHPEARFMIAGEGPMRPVLEKAIAEAGLAERFRLLGVRRDVPDLLRSMDVLALTSDREGCPNAVIEAMATGLPVVATAAGGTVEIVRDRETGRLVAPRDPAAFARGIQDLLDDPEAARRMGSTGLELARSRFAFHRMVERVQSLYESILEGRGAGETAGPREAARA
ncbi:MAG TPA: glycosyltransferase [Candidatus Saccharimonadales bacterium]|nr:glycosyltransferase [Candidatus Saccharimonadales bacterium]